MAIPTQAEIEDKLRGEDLNTWLDLWRAEQGPAKPGALKLIAAVIPFVVYREAAPVQFHRDPAVPVGGELQRDLLHGIAQLHLHGETRRWHAPAIVTGAADAGHLA